MRPLRKRRLTDALLALDVLGKQFCDALGRVIGNAGDEGAEIGFGVAIRGAQAHRRAGLRPDQGRAWHPQVSVAWPGESLRRVDLDLPDPQSLEDLAPVDQRGDRLRGPVRAEV